MPDMTTEAIATEEDAKIEDAFTKEETPDPVEAHEAETKPDSPIRRSSMDFGTALHWLKNGENVTRGNWNGKGQWLEIQTPDEHSKMTKPYIFIVTMQGDLVPWLASQTDMLADDWRIHLDD